MKSKMWLFYALTTMIFFGIWGALIEIPEKSGFPATLSFSVWAVTMIIPSVFALRAIQWRVDFHKKAIFHGLMAGFLGAGGQLLLFIALITGPAYLVFPFVSLAPVVTIILSYVFLKERVTHLGWIGIVIAAIALPLLSYQPPAGDSTSGYFFIVLSLIVLCAWGTQQVFIKKANEHMRSQSIFFYMMITGIMVVPIALMMTDFTQEINWGFRGPYLASIIQLLNAVGALTMVFAFRYGRAMIVSPLMYVGAPVITIIISLAIYAVIPHTVVLIGMIMAIIAVFVLSWEEARAEEQVKGK
jgi:drug/metabolite transporter (DMT)-like permease